MRWKGRLEHLDYMDYHYRILIDGKLCDPVKGGTMDVVNPADSKVIAKAPRCTAEDVDLAAKAAQKARKAWKNTYIGDRANYLMKLAELIRRDQDLLIPMETAQYGGPISKTSRFDIPSAAGELEFMAGIGRWSPTAWWASSPPGISPWSPR